MQNEHKVFRLEWQAIHVNYSYLLDEMAPAQLVPHLVERRLLTPEKAKEVKEKGSRLQKVSTILQALFVNRVLGRLPTFCAALISAGQPHIAERLADSECYIYICMCRNLSPPVFSVQSSIHTCKGAHALPKAALWLFTMFTKLYMYSTCTSACLYIYLCACAF